MSKAPRVTGDFAKSKPKIRVRPGTAVFTYRDKLPALKTLLEVHLYLYVAVRPDANGVDKGALQSRFGYGFCTHEAPSPPPPA